MKKEKATQAKMGNNLKDQQLNTFADVSICL